VIVTRIAAWLFIAAIVVPVVGAHGEHTTQTGNHSRNIEDVVINPPKPQRGEDLTVFVRVYSNASIDHIVVTECRVENYACRAPVRMQDLKGGLYKAVVPWDNAFYRHVTLVGFALVLDYPARPASLPAEAAAYYYLPIPPEPESSPVEAWVVAAGFLLAVACMRRR
jgi:hypothetical protein